MKSSIVKYDFSSGTHCGTEVYDEIKAEGNYLKTIPNADGTNTELWAWQSEYEPGYDPVIYSFVRDDSGEVIEANAHLFRDVANICGEHGLVYIDLLPDRFRKVHGDNFVASTKKMKKSKSIKKDFTSPLTVRIDGKEYSLTSTNDKNDELHEYLRGLISVNKEGVRNYCDTHYELLGYTWYELMHEYIDKDYDYLVYAIADIYVDYIWNTCVFGMTFDRDKYFGITAEWVDGGYDDYRASTKKMKKEMRTDGYTDDDFQHAIELLDEGKVSMNGKKVDWYDKDDIINDVMQYCSDSGRVASIAHWILQAINRGEDYSYEDAYTKEINVTIEKSAKKMKKSKIKKDAKPTIDGLLAVFEHFDKNTLHWSDITEYLREMHEDDIDEDALADLINQYRQPTTDHDWYFSNDDMYVNLNNSPYNASTKKSLKKSKIAKEQIQWYIGMPLIDFMRKNRDAGSLGVGSAYDRYTVICDGEQVGSSYKTVPEEYANCGVKSLELMEMIDFDVLEITIECPADKSAKKSYVPEMPSVREMTDKMRNTRTYRMGE